MESAMQMLLAPFRLQTNTMGLVSMPAPASHSGQDKTADKPETNHADKKEGHAVIEPVKAVAEALRTVLSGCIFCLACF